MQKLIIARDENYEADTYCVAFRDEVHLCLSTTIEDD